MVGFKNLHVYSLSFRKEAGIIMTTVHQKYHYVPTYMQHFLKLLTHITHNKAFQMKWYTIFPSYYGEILY